MRVRLSTSLRALLVDVLVLMVSAVQTTTPVTIPADAPAKENILFAWSWINVEGNREYYM